MTPEQAPLRQSAHIIGLLQRHRLSLSDEKQLQAEMAAVFETAGMRFRREVRLDARDIVDFMVEDVVPDAAGIAVEVKIGGSRRAIFRQLERYAQHDAVGEILLATNVPMNLPREIAGKFTSIAFLARGWM
ncbi:hypothetical protein JQ574_22875 [Bradyrhizobium sp. AUGA SZCCT0158]|uniref:hypothetical protein n=1 Tax=Bradyrhizobium sp. AUGA SZCCT0158 TaxID=2807661 RepID=UPI001BAD7FF5|nr:hypothetical protein [Bradyrhizobium sp. AUGA SZCCT0158]MBR1198845.1 hypothetical protein [Bradyrhizobium sp. AUGA SZCCT0158]